MNKENFKRPLGRTVLVLSGYVSGIASLALSVGSCGESETWSGAYSTGTAREGRAGGTRRRAVPACGRAVLGGRSHTRTWQTFPISSTENVNLLPASIVSSADARSPGRPADHSWRRRAGPPATKAREETITRILWMIRLLIVGVS